MEFYLNWLYTGFPGLIRQSGRLVPRYHGTYHGTVVPTVHRALVVGTVRNRPPCTVAFRCLRTLIWRLRFERPSVKCSHLTRRFYSSFWPYNTWFNSKCSSTCFRRWQLPWSVSNSSRKLQLVSRMGRISCLRGSQGYTIKDVWGHPCRLYQLRPKRQIEKIYGGWRYGGWRAWKKSEYEYSQARMSLSLCTDTQSARSLG
jgi:hypothetical protein